MSIGQSNPQGVDSGSYGLLVDSLNRARAVVEDCLTLGDSSGAFSALSIYERRAEEISQWLRDSAREAQAIEIGGGEGE